MLSTNSCRMRRLTVSFTWRQRVMWTVASKIHSLFPDRKLSLVAFAHGDQQLEPLRLLDFFLVCLYPVLDSFLHCSGFLNSAEKSFASCGFCPLCLFAFH